jgi:hypothetical protein
VRDRQTAWQGSAYVLSCRLALCIRRDGYSAMATSEYVPFQHEPLLSLLADLT